MRGDLLKNVLSSIGEIGMRAIDLIQVIAESPYGTSINGFERKLNQIENARQKELASNRRYYDVVYRLKKDKLIKCEKGKLFVLTSLGKSKLKKLNTNNSFPRVRRTENESKNNLVLAIFDIPEKHRRKRRWLRHILQRYGFSMLQKSVWMGRISIDKEFIKSLKDLGILEYVEILEITKTGSIKLA